MTLLHLEGKSKCTFCPMGEHSCGCLLSVLNIISYTHRSSVSIDGQSSQIYCWCSSHPVAALQLVYLKGNLALLLLLYFALFVSQSGRTDPVPEMRPVTVSAFRAE